MNEVKFSLGNYTVKGRTFKVVVDDADNSTINGNKILTTSDKGYLILTAANIAGVASNTEYNPAFVIGDYSIPAFTCVVSPCLVGSPGGTQFTLSAGIYCVQFATTTVNLDTVWQAISLVSSPAGIISSQTHAGADNLAGIEDRKMFENLLNLTSTTSFFFRINSAKVDPLLASAHNLIQIRIVKL